MPQILISSDVSLDHVRVDLKDLEMIHSLKETSENINFPIQRYNTQSQKQIIGEIETVLEKLLNNWDLNSIGEVVIEYKKIKYHLNIRQDRDFNICTLFNLHEILTSCIVWGGIIYKFNYDYFMKFSCDSIISFLRIKSSLSVEDIQTGLNHLWKNSKNIKPKSISYDEVGMGISLLSKSGMLSLNPITQKYQLTGVGYAFW